MIVAADVHTRAAGVVSAVVGSDASSPSPAASAAVAPSTPSASSVPRSAPAASSSSAAAATADDDRRSGLKRALVAWEQAFHRRNNRAPTSEDVKKDEIAHTYREYERLKAAIQARARDDSATATSGVNRPNPPAAAVSVGGVHSRPTPAAPNKTSSLTRMRDMHPSAVAARVHALAHRTGRSSALPRPTPPPAPPAALVPTHAATPAQPARPPVVPRAPTALFCAGPRHVHQQLSARRKSGLLAQLQSTASLPTRYSIEDEMRQKEAEATATEASSEDQAAHQFFDAAQNAIDARPPRVSSNDEFDEFERDLDAENEIEQEQKHADSASATTMPHTHINAMHAPASIPASTTRSRATKRSRDNDAEDDDDDEDDYSDDSHWSDGDDDGSAKNDAEDDHAPNVAAADGATVAAPKVKSSGTRATRLKPEPASGSTKKRSAISRNYVRHDTHRKNGTQRGPKSAKALRKEKWRQQQGLGRWKSKKEYAREQARKAEEGMYCEVLQPQELKNVLDNVIRSSSDDGTDEEMAAFRQLERNQFGVQHRTTSDVEAEEDPLSLAAEMKEKKRRALEEQATAVARAATKINDGNRHTDESLLALLREQFHYEHFRPGQLDTIKRVLQCHEQAASTSSASSQNVLSILPTGGGKSLIYQLLSLVLPGLTLIISPLLSLMKDQLEHLPPFIRGAIWSSENTPRSVLDLMRDLEANHIKVLFISPEKLLTSGFQNFMLQSVLRTKASPLTALNSIVDTAAADTAPAAPVPGISLVVIDEVHCLAEWSHNFRNSYARLGYVLHRVFRVPRILGLTATATVATTTQVCANLRIPSDHIVRVGLARENLVLSASLVRHEDRFASLVDLLNAPPYKGLKSIVVYVNYKSISESLTKYLRQHGFPSCDYYHAGLPLFQRHKIQTKFMRNQLGIIIATCAFGMGLDKPDIRGVIHFNLPRSFENYIQEIGRAGRDGDISFCHAMWSRCDKEISGSLLYSNGVDHYQLRRLLEQVFDEDKRRTTINHMMRDTDDMDEDDDAADRHRHYVALDVEPLRINMELSEEVVGTILARLERTLGRQWIRLVACIHNHAAIGFHKTNPKVLAHTSGVIRSLLEQNHWLPRSSAHARCGVSFDHERAATAFDAQQLAASSASSADMPDYNSAEYQQLKQQKGQLTMNLCEAASQCDMDVTEVQREIMRLKAAGEISVQWSTMAFVVQVLEWPSSDDSSAMHSHAMIDSQPITLESIASDLLSYLQSQEHRASEKLAIMASALQMASLQHMRCTPRDAADRARRMRQHQIRVQQKRLHGVAVAEDDEPPVPFFDLHKVMDAYFAAEDPSEFLEQLRTQCAEAESDAPESTATTEPPGKDTGRLLREFEEEVLSFVRTHGMSLSSGRELARICHGQKAPSHLAIGRATWQRDRRANGAGDPADADAAAQLLAVSPFAGHPIWGRFKSIEFPIVLARCEEWLQQWKTTAGQRQAEERDAIERRREAKRQRLMQMQAMPTSTSVHRVATASAARRLVTPPQPLVRLAPDQTKPPVNALATHAADADDIVIPDSEDEADEE